ncbi:MAG: hypothetical protein HY269_04210, partial [Deltaproteobacteria bacterium]|nr:hypothetical protein [Deltaproteobacteria bacterium]
SLLISILTPSLSRARQQAKSTVCLATLSEMMKGLVAYTSDNHFDLPPATYAVDPNNPTVFHGWAEALYKSLYNANDYSKKVNFPVMDNRDDEFPFWVCKDGEPRMNSTGHYRVYELSWSYHSLDSVNYRLPLIMDANPNVTDPNDLLRGDIPKEHIAGLEGEAYIDERHYGGANYSFRDGHAERSTQLKMKLALDWDLDPNTPNH